MENPTFIIYTANSVFDMLNGLAALCHTATLYYLIHYNPDTLFWLASLTYFTSTLASHVNVFYNVILVFSRTITIMFPLYKLCKPYVITALTLYPVIWILLTSLDIYSAFSNDTALFSSYLFFSVIIPYPGFSTLKKYFPHDYIQPKYVLCLIGIPYVLPTLISCTCAVFQCYTLKRFKSNKTNLKITITILQLTLLFTVCNTIWFMTIVSFNLFSSIREDWKLGQTYLFYTFGVLMPILNSLLNPVILIHRGTSLRKYVSKVVCRGLLWKRGSNEEWSRKGGSQGESRGSTVMKNKPASSIINETV